MRKESTGYQIISKLPLPSRSCRPTGSSTASPRRMRRPLHMAKVQMQQQARTKAARRPHDYGTAASSGSRLRLETTTPPGCSTVIANAVARLTRRRGSILTKTSPAADVTSNTPPSTG